MKASYSAAGSTRTAGRPSASSGSARPGGTTAGDRPARGRRRAGREPVALAQHPPLVPADRAAELGAARAEHHRHVDAAGKRRGRRARRASGPPAGSPSRSTWPAVASAARPGQQRHAVERRRAVGAGQGEGVVGLEAHLERKDLRLDAGGVVGVAEQDVAAERAPAGPWRRRCRRPSAPPRSGRGPGRWRSALCERISIICGSPPTRKTMLSPGCSSAGGSRVASKKHHLGGADRVPAARPVRGRDAGLRAADRDRAARDADHRHLAPRRRDARVHAAEVAVARVAAERVDRVDRRCCGSRRSPRPRARYARPRPPCAARRRRRRRRAARPLGPSSGSAHRLVPGAEEARLQRVEAPRRRREAQEEVVDAGHRLAHLGPGRRLARQRPDALLVGERGLARAPRRAARSSRGSSRPERSRHRSRLSFKHPAQVVDVDAAGDEARVGDDPTVQRQVGRDALDARLGERARAGAPAPPRGWRRGR